MPVVGSSRNSTHASPISPRARCNRCFMPREYVSTRWSARSVSPTRSSRTPVRSTDLRARELVERAPVLEVLPPGQPPVEAALAAEHDPDLRPHGTRLRDDVVPEHRRGAARRQEHGRENLHKRRLAGAVRAEQPVHLAGGNSQRHAVERIDRLSLARRENAANLVHDDGVHCRDSFRRLPWAGVVLRQLLIAAALAGVAAVPAGAQVTGQSLLMPGVSYQRQVEFTPHGPVVLDVVIAPRPDGSLYTLGPALSNNAIVATQTLTDMEKDAARPPRPSSASTVTSSRRTPASRPGSSCAAACSTRAPAIARSSLGIAADGTLTVAGVALRRHVARQRPAAPARPQRAGRRRATRRSTPPRGGRRLPRRAASSIDVIGDAAAATPNSRAHGHRDAGRSTTAPSPIPPGGAVLVVARQPGAAPGRGGAGRHDGRDPARR